LPICLAILFALSPLARADRDLLWEKIGGECVPGYMANHTYKPCALVDLAEKYAIYKVDNDKYQYLLLPTFKVSGIEDPQLQRDDIPPYLYDAWQSKTFLVERFGMPMNNRMISLTINSKYGRSQDQLHIHISCLSAKARAVISGLPANQIDDQWSRSTLEISPDAFFYRKISLDQLRTESRSRTWHSGSCRDGNGQSRSGKFPADGRCRHENNQAFGRAHPGSRMHGGIAISH
jgi:CDP-diacylglycerol pyrophosphatase